MIIGSFFLILCRTLALSAYVYGCVTYNNHVNIAHTYLNGNEIMCR